MPVPTAPKFEPVRVTTSPPDVDIDTAPDIELMLGAEYAIDDVDSPLLCSPTLTFHRNTLPTPDTDVHVTSTLDTLTAQFTAVYVTPNALTY
jgi:hypothetical protein